MCILSANTLFSNFHSLQIYRTAIISRCFNSKKFKNLQKYARIKVAIKFYSIVLETITWEKFDKKILFLDPFEKFYVCLFEWTPSQDVRKLVYSFFGGDLVFPLEFLLVNILLWVKTFLSP